MVMAPGGNLGGNAGSLQPANAPFTIGSPVNTPISVTGIQNPTGVVIDGGTSGVTIQNGAVVVANFQPIATPGLQLRGGLYLSGGNGTAVSSNALWDGSGAPAGGLGNNGDYYFRNDTPGTANQRIYVKAAGSWTGIV